MKKKVLSLILIFAMLMGTMFILSGCGSNNNGTTNNQEVGENTSEDDNMIYPLYDRSSQKYGYANRKGEYIIEPKFESAGFFDEETKLAIVSTAQSHYGIINMSGEYILEPNYSHDTKISNGYIIIDEWIKNGHHYSVADLNGNVLVELGLQYIGSVSKNGMIACREYGYYNLDGNLVIKAYNTGAFNENGYASASLMQSNGKALHGILSEDGTWKVEPFAYEVRGVNKNGYAVYKTEDEKYGIININGEKKETSYKYITAFSDNGFAFAEDSSGKYGIINEKGEQVVEAKFDSSDSFNENGVAMVKVDGKYGSINSNGEYIIEPTYTKVFSGGNSGMWEAWLDGNRVVIGKDGKELIKK